MSQATDNKMILAINPGSTSTKIAVYLDEVAHYVASIEHSAQDLEKYGRVNEQYAFRKEAVVQCLKEQGIELEMLSAVVARGGTLPPIQSGAYRINRNMYDLLKSDTLPEHASNLAAMIAWELADERDLLAIIYDGVSTDEFEEVARISGMADIPRDSLSHALNSKAMARKAAALMGSQYHKENFIVAHLGGGITVSAHRQGRMIDIVSDDEGPFSPERSGRVPCRKLINMCFSGQYDHKTVSRKLRGRGGLISYLGTGNAREIQERIRNGDAYAGQVYYAMAYQIAKAIAELTAVLKGKISRVILTGGLAHSTMLVDWIVDHIGFIAPIEVYPGENELEALALGALRVLQGEEEVKEYGQ
jgi:butyrate kinase